MRLIDANALNADFIQRYTANADVYLLVRKILNDAPAVDAVEVVRCKDCKHATFLYSIGKYMCKKGCGAIKAVDDFCSYGERKVSE